MAIDSFLVVDDLDSPSLVVAPYETNTPLVVDANAELALTVTMQSFQPMAGWYS
jgi:hypothetical protein